jgi:hypothetical protein
MAQNRDIRDLLDDDFITPVNIGNTPPSTLSDNSTSA